MPQIDLTPLGDEFSKAFDAAVDQWVRGLEAQAKAGGVFAAWRQEQLLEAKECQKWGYTRSVRDYLNGQGGKPGNLGLIPHTIWERVHLPLLACARLAKERRWNRDRDTIDFRELRSLTDQGRDLRVVAKLASLIGLPDAIDTVSQSFFGEQGHDGLPPDGIWPFFAENPQRLDKVIGLNGPPEKDFLITAMRILATFPTLPPKYVPVLADYACSPYKVRREWAQKLLLRQPDVLDIAWRTLAADSPGVQAAGVAWIGRIGDPAAIGRLRDLTNHSSALVQAAAWNALHRLGCDIFESLTPDVMLASAIKNAPAKLPPGLKWFPEVALPACRWASGQPVEPVIIRWWVVLARRLKDARGFGLIPLYVSLLDKPSRQALGTFILDAWVAEDTRRLSDDEVRAYVIGRIDAQYDTYLQWMKSTWPGALSKTKDQMFDELRREKAREYATDLTSDKGLLALTVGAPGHHVATVIRRYIREQHGRRAQLTALITAASASDDPAAIQLVLSIARHFRQPTVQKIAGGLIEDIAERLDWTTEQLADHAIPDGGFGDDGTLELSYGPRCFTGRVARSEKTGAFTVALSSPDGKPIAALPKPSAIDDPDAVAQAKLELATAKREIAQVVALQTARLFEAMCLRHSWSPSEWRACFLDHPVMRHLIATLVWQVSDTGRLFRPTPDGTLLDIDDQVTLLADGQVSLAHRLTVSPDDAQRWQAHLRDYRVAPLFGQFEATMPPIDQDARTILDHQGWVSDSHAIKARAIQRGYVEGPLDDEGSNSYIKPIPGADIVVEIGVTGSPMFQARVPAAVVDLTFRRFGDSLRLSEVPPILLAESYADYVFVAEAGAYDQNYHTVVY